jgi:hypothetical protein
MHILTNTSSDALAAALPMRLRLAVLGGDLAARLTGSTLYSDPTATADDQPLAIAEAATFLATGQNPSTARRVRHLRQCL